MVNTVTCLDAVTDSRRCNSTLSGLGYAAIVTPGWHLGLFTFNPCRDWVQVEVTRSMSGMAFAREIAIVVSTMTCCDGITDVSQPRMGLNVNSPA